MKNKWYNSIGKLIVVCILIWPVGLYGIYKNKSLSTITKLALGFLCIIAASVMINVSNKTNNISQAPAVASKVTPEKVSAVVSKATPEEVPAAPPNRVQSNEPEYAKIGQILHTKYFDVTVDDAGISKGGRVSDYSELEIDGAKYLIIKVTIKNISDESRYTSDGNIIFVDDNGKQYKFDKSETVIGEGWGLTSQINPLLSITRLVAFKLPGEIKGTAYYNPPRSKRTDLITIGYVE